MMTIVIDAGGDARAEDERGNQAEDNVENVNHVRYRTSITLRTTSLATPGRFCTRVRTSLNAFDSPPCLKHSAQRGRFVKSRRAKASCMMAKRGESRISSSDCVFRSPST